MKRMVKRLITLILSIACICSVFVFPVSAATTVKLDTSSYNFTKIGQSYVFMATVNSPNGKCAVASSNNYSIVTPQYVSHSGNKYLYKIIAKGIGSTKINVICNGVTTSMTVSVGADLRTLFNAPTLFAFDTNSANGVRIALLANYKGSKEIKYYTVNFSAYNSVGDSIIDEITGKNKFSLKAVGPVKTGEQICLYNIFAYSSVCSKIVIDSIDVEYSDGTTVTGIYPYSTTQNTDAAIQSYIKK